jgi:hypothetical protein
MVEPMRKNHALIFLIFLASTASAAVSLNPDEVRAWSKDDKARFPTPLAAVFKKDDRSLVFVGDHHIDQFGTYKYLEAALKKYSPEIVVVESVDYADGENPKQWLNDVLSKPKPDLSKETGAGRIAAWLAHENGIPVIGGEPSIEEEMKSPFLQAKGYEPDDIRNVQVLQRIPYRRDVLKMTQPDVFFDYAMKLYRIQETKAAFMASFSAWYKKRAMRDFDYAGFSKSETDVNCTPKDSFFQNVACATNIDRDRALVSHISELLKSHHRVLVVYGTVHFVQEYPAFIKAFGSPPEYLKLP